MKWIATLIFSLFLVNPAHAAILGYVDPFTTPSSGHAGTIGDPWQTWTEPCAAGNGIGGTVLVNPGSYEGAASALYTINCSGINGNPIIFKGNIAVPSVPGANAGAPVLQNTSGTNFSGRTIQIRFNTAYVEFQNLILTGSVANANCLFYETDPSHVAINHHITYDHLTVSNCGCDSLYAQGGDYYTITSNIAHDNGATCSSASVSGIHVYQPSNFDTLPGVHILISGNEVWNESKGTGPQSDGNGIQAPDDANGTQGSWCTNNPTRCPYTGQMTIQNNIIYGNDGNGYSDFSSSNPLEVVNNTFYQNVANQTAGSVWSEISFNTTPNAAPLVYNNLVQSKGASYTCTLAETSGTGFVVTANANDNFTCTTAFSSSGNGSYSLGAANITGDPNLSLATADFTPQSGSAALFAAIGAYAPATDIFGNARPSAGVGCTAALNPTIGAIQTP